MFDYEKFEKNIVEQAAAVFHKWTEENDDLYIISLDCAASMDSIGIIANTRHYLEEQAQEDEEDYWYYKYCEEEWDLFDTFDTVSADMRRYLDDNAGIFVNPDTHEYTELFDRHREQITAHCRNALFRFRQEMNAKHADIMLAFQIRELLDSDERKEIFQAVNSEAASEEYAKHMEEFA